MIAEAAAPGTSASSSAYSRSASERNGTPLASCTSARSRTSGGTAGFCWMPATSVAVRLAIRTDPASAVPSDAPRLVAVFWSPPTSGLSSSGTADTLTLPSWEARRADAQAQQQQRHRHDLGRGVLVDAGEQHDRAGEHRDQREPHDPARVGVRAKRGIPTAATQQRHRQRQEADAGVDRREPERDRQEQRDDEEHARLDEVLEEEHPQAADKLRVLQHRRAHERLVTAPLEPRLPLEEQPDHEQPAEDQPQRRRDAEQLRRVGLRDDPSPDARAQHAEDRQAEPGRRQHDPDEVDLRAACPGARPRCAASAPGSRARSAPRRRTPAASSGTT